MPKVDEKARKVVIWRVEHRYFTRIDADIYNGRDDKPERVIDLDEERAVALVRGLFPRAV